LKHLKVTLSLALVFGLAASAILLAPKKTNEFEKLSSASWVSSKQSRMVAIIDDGGGDGGDAGDAGTP
jgi:hypothetical protein